MEAQWCRRGRLWFVVFDTWPSDVFNPIGLWLDFKALFGVVVVDV